MIANTILMVLMLICSAFFSGMEIAFVSANRLKIELKSLSGNWSGKILSHFVKDTPKVITTILVGNNLALVMYGIAIAKLIESWLTGSLGGIFDAEASYFQFLVLLIQTLISTVVILIFGEYLPKAIFRINANRIIYSFSYILGIFYLVFYIPVFIIHTLSKFFIKFVLRLPYEEEELAFGKKDLDHFVRESLDTSDGGDLEQIDAEMFVNALSFNEIKARECMIPRTEIESISVESPVSELLSMFTDTEHSKIIVYRESLDNILGYVHSSSMFKSPATIEQAVQSVLMVPETMPANVLLSEFTKNRKSLAIVVDEFGGTEGMVTIEDLVEEVFGEIEDEHDVPEEEELLAKRLDENTWLFSARCEVDEVNKDFELDLPEGEYNTLSGLVMFIAEDIPEVNAIFQIEGYTITIMDAEDNKVNTIKIRRR